MGEERLFFYKSPVGMLRLKAEGGYLTGLTVVRDASRAEGFGSFGDREMSAAGGKDGMECAEGALPDESGGLEPGGKELIGVPGELEPAGKQSAGVTGETESAGKETDVPDQPKDPVLQETVRQLDEYFAGKRREFFIPLKTHGTDFQERVWKALRTIPYGETRTYGQIAEQVGNPKGGRAVGGANHNNPILILTPCHRVIGADGSLTGFGGGLEVKEALLALEKTVGKVEG